MLQVALVYIWYVFRPHLVYLLSEELATLVRSHFVCFEKAG